MLVTLPTLTLFRVIGVLANPTCIIGLHRLGYFIEKILKSAHGFLVLYSNLLSFFPPVCFPNQENMLKGRIKHSSSADRFISLYKWSVPFLFMHISGLYPPVTVKLANVSLSTETASFLEVNKLNLEDCDPVPERQSPRWMSLGFWEASASGDISLFWFSAFLDKSWLLIFVSLKQKF